MMLQISLTRAGQICGSCSGVEHQAACQHSIICDDSEICYVRRYRTESGSNLLDLGCIAATECPHIISTIVGKRAEGNHVTCVACCNNASACNRKLSCEAAQNQGLVYPRDCSELNLRERINGTHTIYPYGVIDKPVEVYCIFDFNDVAWTVIQRRIDGSVDFYRDWADYVAGFGVTNGEYWLGLDNIHALTSIQNAELKVVMMDFENTTKHALYAFFHVDSASKNYRLTVRGYSGTAGDSLGSQSGSMFSTFDNVHDSSGSFNCAKHYHGAWWYAKCHRSNLNGKYLNGTHPSYADGIEWYAWHGYHYSLKSTLMMIRRSYVLS